MRRNSCINVDATQVTPEDKAGLAFLGIAAMHDHLQNYWSSSSKTSSAARR